MAIFHASFYESNDLNADFLESDDLAARFGEVYKVPVGTYADLPDKPMIEGNVLIGDKTYKQLGLDEITPQEIDELFDELIYGG